MRGARCEEKKKSKRAAALGVQANAIVISEEVAQVTTSSDYNKNTNW